MKEETWKTVREYLIWYQELENPDHGDLVIAEEAILNSISNTWNEAIDTAIAAVPDERIPKISLDDLNNGAEMLYADGHNSCRNQTIEALKKLKKT